MPEMDVYHINDERVQEIRRVKQNLGSLIDRPFKQPSGIAKTVQPDVRLDLDSWFAYIKRTLRETDKKGNLIIK